VCLLLCKRKKKSSKEEQDRADFEEELNAGLDLFKQKKQQRDHDRRQQI